MRSSLTTDDLIAEFPETRTLLVMREKPSLAPDYFAVEVPSTALPERQARIALDAWVSRKGGRAEELAVLDTDTLQQIIPEAADEDLGHLGFYLGACSFAGL